MNRLSCRFLVTSVCLLAACFGSAYAQGPKTLDVMPLPANYTLGQGEFPITGKFGIKLEGYTGQRLSSAKRRFLAVLSRETGIPLWREARFRQPEFIVRTAGRGPAVQQLGENESYHLDVTPDRVLLTAPNPLGILHGLQTFLQLVKRTRDGYGAPVVKIYDYPRFPWRGLMIDSSRHFLPVSAIERTLDGMAAVKLNVLHWHLSDDQGFRVQSRKYPLLQEEGSDGLYYTQRQIRAVIRYARDRGIRVVPEFDMPCHTQSWFVGYPQLAAGEGPHHVAIHVGVHDAAMNPTQPYTYEFINGFIGEMAHLFPDAYFHIGGDECNGKEWNGNPQIRHFMRVHHLANDAALQAYFTAKVQKIVASHHKIMMGWDEVLQPETPKSVVIQSWRGQSSLAKAARHGNRAVLSTGYYLDLLESASRMYSVEPLGGPAAKLTPREKKRILGGEACMWTEFVSPENLDSRIWPRTAVIAERLWSPGKMRNAASMYARLAVVARKLKYYGIDPQAETDVMLQRLTGQSDPAALKVLASVVKPSIRGYRRGSREYTTFTPLNGLAAAVPPESVAARHFRNLVERVVSAQATPQERQRARMRLVQWRDNDAKLEPLLRQSPVTADLVPVSKGLKEAAAIGLQAFDDLASHTRMSVETRRRDGKILQSVEEPIANVRDMVAPSVEMLVQAASARRN